MILEFNAIKVSTKLEVKSPDNVIKIRLTPRPYSLFVADTHVTDITSMLYNMVAE